MIDIKRYLKYVGNAVTILSIAFVIYALFKLDIDFGKLANPVAIIICLGGALGVTLTVYILAYAWKNTLDYLSESKSVYKEVAHVYGKANIGKYLPGNVMHYVERNLFASKIGLNQFELAISSVVEVIGFVIVTFLVSVICAHNELAMAMKEYVKPIYLIVGVIAVVLVCIAAVFVCRKSEKIRNIISRLMNGKFLIVFAKNIILYLIVFIILGAILVLICKYILEVDLNASQCAMMIAYYMLAWVLGFVVPGAPGGIGVREAVLVLLMGTSSMISSGAILTAALVHRMISIFGDIIGYLIAICIGEKSIKQE